jgi:hypothetical protein
VDGADVAARRAEVRAGRDRLHARIDARERFQGPVRGAVVHDEDRRPLGKREQAP